MGRRRVGIIVNPIAGMGGRVGLKGTDGAAILARARSLGAEPMAAERCALALEAMGDAAERVHAPTRIGTGADTSAAAAAMVRTGADLILFAGGDGTARDVLAGAGNAVPILGVPTGVKMHSAVFGTSPRAAGRLAARFLEGAARLRDAEVMDLDEDGLREGRVAARLFGVARVPYERGLLQASKAGARPDDEAALDALARVLVRDWPDDRLMIVGCGTTTRRIKRSLGFEGTLLGVDVALGGRVIALDANEAQLLRLLDCAESAAIVASVTGGQGFLFGRGNQQISAKVLRRVGRDNITVVTGAQKLAALDPAVLHVDTGSADVDAMFCGYMHIHTAPGQRMVMRVAAH